MATVLQAGFTGPTEAQVSQQGTAQMSASLQALGARLEQQRQARTENAFKLLAASKPANKSFSDWVQDKGAYAAAEVLARAIFRGDGPATAKFMEGVSSLGNLSEEELIALANKSKLLGEIIPEQVAAPTPAKNPWDFVDYNVPKEEPKPVPTPKPTPPVSQVTPPAPAGSYQTIRGEPVAPPGATDFKVAYIDSANAKGFMIVDKDGHRAIPEGREALFTSPDEAFTALTKSLDPNHLSVKIDQGKVWDLNRAQPESISDYTSWMKSKMGPSIEDTFRAELTKRFPEQAAKIQAASLATLQANNPNTWKAVSGGSITPSTSTPAPAPVGPTTEKQWQNARPAPIPAILTPSEQARERAMKSRNSRENTEVSKEASTTTPPVVTEAERARGGTLQEMVDRGVQYTPAEKRDIAKQGEEAVASMRKTVWRAAEGKSMFRDGVRERMLTIAENLDPESPLANDPQTKKYMMDWAQAEMDGKQAAINKLNREAAAYGIDTELAQFTAETARIKAMAELAATNNVGMQNLRGSVEKGMGFYQDVIKQAVGNEKDPRKQIELFKMTSAELMNKDPTFASYVTALAKINADAMKGKIDIKELSGAVAANIFFEDRKTAKVPVAEMPGTPNLGGTSSAAITNPAAKSYGEKMGIKLE